MKTIYFIRHAESEGNAGPIRQDGTSSLSERGLHQASFLAERCSRLRVDTIVASTMTRAQQTANIIGKKLGVSTVKSDLFTERRRPSAQTGRLKDDPHSLIIDKEIWENFSALGYRHSDEENFEDLRTRARAALQFLAGRPETNIVVVTHGLFMRIILAYIVFGEQLTGKECELFMRTFHMENTGLTIAKYSEKDAESPWWIWTWNDHAHLG